MPNNKNQISSRVIPSETFFGMWLISYQSRKKAYTNRGVNGKRLGWYAYNSLQLLELEDTAIKDGLEALRYQRKPI